MLKSLFIFNFKKWPIAFIVSLVLIVFVFFFIQTFCWSFSYSPEKTMTNVIPQLSKPQHYDLVVLGTSHAGEMKLNTHLQLTEKLLNKKVSVLAKASGGILPNKTFLELFFDRGNDADTILVFIDPFMFSSKETNESTVALRNESFDKDFFQKIITERYSLKAIMSYISFNFNLNHFTKKMVNAGNSPHVGIVTYDLERWEKRAQIYRMENEELIEHYIGYLEKLVQKYPDKKWLFIAPPILLPPEMIGEYFDIFNKYFYKFIHCHPIAC